VFNADTKPPVNVHHLIYKPQNCKERHYLLIADFAQKCLTANPNRQKLSEKNGSGENSKCSRQNAEKTDPFSFRLF